MKKASVLDLLLILCFAGSILLYMAVQFVSGKSVSLAASVALFLIASCSLQWLFLRLFAWKALQHLPTVLASLIVLWGCWLYAVSPAWQNTSFSGLLPYLIPLFGSFLTNCIYHLIHRN